MPVLVIARKELRAFFQSPVALLFLASFLVVDVVKFFSWSRFFARNLADARPLFDVMPLLLIALVAAITMRMWAEEQKTGTLEVLLTLPLKTWQVVTGKFAAGMVLVAIALAMTLPIPFTVSALGDLDWGPVFGGYLASFLLAGTYMAIGLCVSARTDNQVVALMLTIALCGALYFIGSDNVTALFGNSFAEILRELGTGSRFDSVLRGVIDLRDLAYYLGLTSFFLVLNAYFVDVRRLDSGSPGGQRRHGALALMVVLVGFNAAATVLWLTPVTWARADLTANGDYSLSLVTRRMLSELDEPLRLRGFFSERTHPKLAPLVPQIEDLMAEYEVYGMGKVLVEFADPNADPALEEEIGQRYGIESVPFQVADRTQKAVVNSFFHILVEYGDRHETLSFDDLIEVEVGENDVDVRLRNLEYDLTKTIKRVVQDFQSIESVLAKLPEPATLTLYATPDTLPDEWREVPTLFAEVAGEIAATAPDRLSFSQVDPGTDPELKKKLQESWGIRPMALDLFGRRTFYLAAVLQVGDRSERILPWEDPSEANLKKTIEAAIRRVTPGQLKTVGLFTEEPQAPPPNPQLPPQFQPPPPRPDFSGLEEVLGDEYQVERVSADATEIPPYIDVLLVGKTGLLSDEASYALDQYLMRGGRVVAMAGHWHIATGSGLESEREDEGLLDLLGSWGVAVGDSMVLDSQNAMFPYPTQTSRGRLRIELLPYPYFVDVRPDAYDHGFAALAGVPNLSLPWSSPLEVPDKLEGRTATVLAHSSSGSWLSKTGDIQPDFDRYPDAGFPPAGDAAAPHPLIVAVQGTFPSAWASKPAPGVDTRELSQEGADGTGRTIKESLGDPRLVVIGSSEFASDLMMQVAKQPAGDVHLANLQLLYNLVDWATEDTDLLSIRSQGSLTRTLYPTSEWAKTVWEIANYVFALFLLALVALIPLLRRLTTQPIVGGAR